MAKRKVTRRSVAKKIVTKKTTARRNVEKRVVVVRKSIKKAVAKKIAKKKVTASKKGARRKVVVAAKKGARRKVVVTSKSGASKKITRKKVATATKKGASKKITRKKVATATKKGASKKAATAAKSGASKKAAVAAPKKILAPINKPKTASPGQIMMEKIVSLCKRRGFIFQSSEIYGGLASAYDYGPLGVELKNNIKKEWWRDMVWGRRDIVGLDAAILMHPTVWKASGHIDSFVDPLVDCLECKLRHRADELLDDQAGINADKLSCEEINKLLAEHPEVKCPSCGGKISEARTFNILMETYLGVLKNSKSVCYLRGETCQGIYVNFLNVLNSTRIKIPFGVAQIGKAFRNEITPGNFTFRTREFEQMEMQYFVKPEVADKFYESWKKARIKWYEGLGVNKNNMRFHEHNKLAHYAKAAFDIEYKTPIGWKELEGVHNRGNWDLSRHTEFSGEDLSYFDQETGERYIPYIVETSAGADRSALFFLLDAYHEEKAKSAKGEMDTRVVLKLHHRLAPIKIAVLPLSKQEKLSEEALRVWEMVKSHWHSEYDETQSIGKRYRRQDEIGTPFCVTIDFDSLNDKAVTVRDRDSMKQDRIPIKNLVEYLQSKLDL